MKIALFKIFCDVKIYIEISSRSQSLCLSSVSIYPSLKIYSEINSRLQYLYLSIVCQFVSRYIPCL